MRNRLVLVLVSINSIVIAFHSGFCLSVSFAHCLFLLPRQKGNVANVCVCVSVCRLQLSYRRLHSLRVCMCPYSTLMMRWATHTSVHDTSCESFELISFVPLLFIITIIYFLPLRHRCSCLLLHQKYTRIRCARTRVRSICVCAIGFVVVIVDAVVDVQRILNGTVRYT